MGRWNQTKTNYHPMSNSNLPKFGLCLFPISIFWLCLFQNPSYYEFFICQQAEFFMSISKGLIPNSTLCLIPKVLLQCLVFEPSMSNSKGLPTPIHSSLLNRSLGRNSSLGQGKKKTQCGIIAMALWFIQSKQKFVLGNGQVLAALAGLNFQVQFSMPYSIRFKRFSK